MSTISTSQNVSDAPVVKPKSADVVNIFDTVNTEGSGHATLVVNENGPAQLDVPSTPQSACT